MTHVWLRPLSAIGVIVSSYLGLGASSLTLVQLCSVEQGSGSPINSLSPFLLQVQPNPTVKVI